MIGTVRDFKEHVLRQAGLLSIPQFCELSEAYRAFWIKLNHLGARNMESQPPDKVPDIDATVQLTKEEWAELEDEFRQLELL
jgi:hypothetical protein